MKKQIVIFMASLFLLGGCQSPVLNSDPTVVSDEPVGSQIVLTTPNQTEINGDTKIYDNYLGSEYEGNYVWGGAMNLAWNELNENILGEKLQLATDNAKILSMVAKFNKPVFTKDDLDKDSYYIKSGYGQETVDLINKESREKFPQKSFADLDITLASDEIISYAYFLKAVEYLTQFEEKPVSFEDEEVKGFSSTNEAQRDNIVVLKYEDDDHFLLELELKDEQDQLFLAKGFDMKDPAEVVEAVNKPHEEMKMGENDQFEAPNLHLDYRRDYLDLIGQFLANKGFEAYFIGEMYENIKFDMDHKGAKVENEAVITLEKVVMQDPEKTKKLLLNKPYWVIMKRKESQNPYFLLGVNNTALMEK